MANKRKLQKVWFFNQAGLQTEHSIETLCGLSQHLLALKRLYYKLWKVYGPLHRTGEQNYPLAHHLILGVSGFGI